MEFSSENRLIKSTKNPEVSFSLTLTKAESTHATTTIESTSSLGSPLESVFFFDVVLPQEETKITTQIKATSR